jgi:ABC-type methionine transport system ATPase subunit
VNEEELELMGKGTQWFLSNIIPMLGITVVLVTATLGWVIAIESRTTVVEQRVTSHEALTEIQFAGFAQMEAAEFEQQVIHQAETISRLERIEDGVKDVQKGVNEHIADSNNR